MIRTRICDLLGIDHPIVLGGMATATSAPLVAAVSNAGGLGTLGAAALSPASLKEGVAAIRAGTSKPFGINHLLFNIKEDGFAATLELKPAVVALAWAHSDQDLRPYIQRAKATGAKVMYMVNTVSEAKKAVAAGADIIVAQGTEGGGHVSWMCSMPLIPMVVQAVAPVPVLAAGGIADGRGLAAALALGAEGVLLGTRMLATDEAPIHPNFKQAIVKSDGHDTMLTEIPDIAAQSVWPGAMGRAWRNRFIERWAGREWALRQCAREVGKEAFEARRTGDVDNAPLLFGQDAGLIDSVRPAAEIVATVVRDAEAIMRERLPGMLGAR